MAPDSTTGADAGHGVTPSPGGPSRVGTPCERNVVNCHDRDLVPWPGLYEVDENDVPNPDVPAVWSIELECFVYAEVNANG